MSKPGSPKWMSAMLKDPEFRAAVEAFMREKGYDQSPVFTAQMAADAQEFGRLWAGIASAGGAVRIFTRRLKWKLKMRREMR